MTGTRSISPRLRRAARHGLCLLALAAASAAYASEFHGTVTYHGLPVPGATVTLTQNGKSLVTVTDTQGFYSFPTLTDGTATLQVQMTGFAALQQAITIAPSASMTTLELTQLSLAQIQTTLQPLPSTPLTGEQALILPKRTADSPKPQGNQLVGLLPSASADEIADRATDGLLVNGSVNNAATSRYTLAPRFGNTASGKSLYTFGAYLRLDTSALDAKSYSLTGIDTAKPDTSQLTGGFGLQGPLKIPHLLRNGPNIFINYERTRNSIATTTPGLVPDLAERTGDLSTCSTPQGQPVTLYNPATGQPYPGNQLPVSPQAQALLNLYPLPNLSGNAQLQLSGSLSHQHPPGLSAAPTQNKTFGRFNQLTGAFSRQACPRQQRQPYSASSTHTGSLGIKATSTGAHLHAHTRADLGYQLQPPVHTAHAVLGRIVQNSPARPASRQRPGPHLLGTAHRSASPAASPPSPTPKLLQSQS